MVIIPSDVQKNTSLLKYNNNRSVFTPSYVYRCMFGRRWGHRGIINRTRLSRARVVSTARTLYCFPLQICRYTAVSKARDSSARGHIYYDTVPSTWLTHIRCASLHRSHLLSHTAITPTCFITDLCLAPTNTGRLVMEKERGTFS